MKKQTSDIIQASIIGVIIGIVLGILLIGFIIDKGGINPEYCNCNCEEIQPDYDDVKSYCDDKPSSCYRMMNCQNTHDKIYLCNGK